jgi:hypothetical protein
MSSVSRKARIDAKCKECIYDPGAQGSWRFQTQNCEDRRCPLWPVRPKQGKAAGPKTTEKGEKIDEFWHANPVS